jgi:nitrogen fixation NifU-like protein
MCDCLGGTSLSEALELASTFRASLAGAPVGALPKALAALTAVAAFPARIRCAALPWEALERASGELVE